MNDYFNDDDPEINFEDFSVTSQDIYATFDHLDFYHFIILVQRS